MKTKNPVTVDELNDIQAKWMALDSNDPQPVKASVFELLKLFPNRYLNVSEDLKTACVIVDGQPYSSDSKPFKEALRTLKEITTQWNVNDTRFDVAWCGYLGKWVTIQGQ